MNNETPKSRNPEEQEEPTLIKQKLYSDLEALQDFKPACVPENLLHDRNLRNLDRTWFQDQAVPKLGGIVLLAPIGQGGMGSVYYGVHTRLHMDVAVKIMSPEIAKRGPDLVERFLREARLAARLKSNHLVGVVDVNREKELNYIVMEHVVGETADSWLCDHFMKTRKGMLEIEAVQICLSAARGLADAHAQGIIHRDIKPGNILIPKRKEDLQPRFAEAKLSDLGIAKFENEIQALTLAATSMGTFGYMSPEQARDARSAGKPADVFSLGATLYTLLAARPPLRGPSLPQILQATLKCEYERIENLRADLTPETVALIDRCLSKNPEDRYADGAELARALEECLVQLKKLREKSSTPTRVAPPRPSGSNEAAEPSADRSERAPLHVLVIEDDSVSRTIIKCQLENLALGTPLAVDLATSAEEAQGMIPKLPPDIVITDVCMSGSDGYEMIEWIRAQPGLMLTPVVVSSSIPEELGKQRCLMIGADAYLQKPVDKEVLKRIMSRMVKRVRPETKA